MRYIIPIVLLSTWLMLDKLPQITKFFFYCALAIYLFEVLRFIRLVWKGASVKQALEYIRGVYES